SGKAQGPSGPLSGKAQGPSGPLSGKAQGPSGPLSGKAQGPSGPLSGKAQGPSGPLSGKAQRPGARRRCRHGSHHRAATICHLRIARASLLSEPVSRSRAAARTVQSFSDVFERIVENVGTVIQGKDDAVRLALTCLVAEGHLLIE